MLAGWPRWRYSRQSSSRAPASRRVGDEGDVVGVVGGDADQAVVAGRVGPDVVLGQAVERRRRQRARSACRPRMFRPNSWPIVTSSSWSCAHPGARGVVPVDAGAAEVAQRLVQVVARAGVLGRRRRARRARRRRPRSRERSVRDLAISCSAASAASRMAASGWDFAIRRASAPTFVNSAVASSNRSSNPIAASPVVPGSGCAPTSRAMPSRAFAIAASVAPARSSASAAASSAASDGPPGRSGLGRRPGRLASCPGSCGSSLPSTAGSCSGS